MPGSNPYRIFFLCGISTRDVMLDIEKYEFLVLGIKYLILLGIISLIPKYFSCYYQAFTFQLELMSSYRHTAQEE